MRVIAATAPSARQSEDEGVAFELVVNGWLRLRFPRADDAGGGRGGHGAAARTMLALTLPRSVRIYLATTPADLRKSFDALGALAREGAHNLYSGHMFVFRSRRVID